PIVTHAHGEIAPGPTMGGTAALESVGSRGRGIESGSTQLSHDQVQGGHHDFTPFRPGSRGRVRSHFAIVSGDHLGRFPTRRSGQGTNPSPLARSNERTDSPRYLASPRLSRQTAGTGAAGLPAASLADSVRADRFTGPSLRGGQPDGQSLARC